MVERTLDEGTADGTGGSDASVGSGRERRRHGGGADDGTEDVLDTEADASSDQYADAEPVLELRGVAREYGTETAVSGLDLTVREGELLTLLGPSGCGKTTTLRTIAGLEEPTDGVVVVAGETVAGDGAATDPEDRDVGMVFQEFALFPHLSVAENVAFGLQDAGNGETERRVADLLDLVGLSEYADTSPDALSGGQRQRVALARSLAPEPDVLLLDEPFSNLDVRLRTRMREEVRRILKEAGVTAVSVTHDQEEALSISDRVAVMHDGTVEQVGTPEEVFEHPESRFVAEFIGQASFLPGRFEDGSVETALGVLGEDLLQGLTPDYDGADIDVLVRPDDLRAVPTEGAGDGVIVGRTYTGPSFVYDVELDGGRVVRCEHNHATEFALDRRVAVDLVADHTLAWYPASSDAAGE
ncbi:ABC transporter ATP-binding protein [Halorarum halophilum]|uniref:Molybdate/tungstate import ATP-binding protein WtpC n=1 Tax=Halorarum halophilum TaxID=2743090 RepID=A0A7D5GIG0_9EURY|nr:ABC transporter ATP-binding protein [Halobaculum halophilum]QLG26167.1 ABC transporter ATP-binding protein [Halobaculum halophilum]